MERLEYRIERFLRTGEGNFEHLAIELFDYQFKHNAAYQTFCRAQNSTPDEVHVWTDIPAVSVQAFKTVDLTTVPVGHAAAVFHSSITTGKTPSRHFIGDLLYYHMALQWGFSHTVLADQAALPFFILAPSPAEAPHSSLSWMLDVVKRKWGVSGSDYYLQRGLLDDWKLGRALKVVQARQQPIALLGTTLAFLQFFDLCRKSGQSYSMPPGSRLMDTGGMKTEKREINREQFLHEVQRFLGIPASYCWNEYGMCEMSSQFYARGESLTMQGPPWVRTLVMDPVTGKTSAQGAGLLRHYDLANVMSVMAIQTEDVGDIVPEGFVLKGRASGSDLKGCSLFTEAYLKP